VFWHQLGTKRRKATVLCAIFPGAKAYHSGVAHEENNHSDEVPQGKIYVQLCIEAEEIEEEENREDDLQYAAYQ
jgi:hypothetical protein